MSCNFTHDQSLFLNFRPVANPCPVQGFGGLITPPDIGNIKLEYKDQTRAITSLFFWDAYFMPNSGVNLISQRQL